MFTKKDNTPTTHDDGAEPKQGKTALQSEQLLEEDNLLRQIADLKAEKMLVDVEIKSIVDLDIIREEWLYEKDRHKKDLSELIYKREKLTEQIYELLDDRRCLKQKNSARAEC